VYEVVCCRLRTRAFRKMWLRLSKININFHLLFYNFRTKYLNSHFTYEYSFSLISAIHAAVQNLSTTLLINRYRPNVEFKFNSALRYKISQCCSQIKMLLWEVVCCKLRTRAFRKMWLHLSKININFHLLFYNFRTKYLNSHFTTNSNPPFAAPPKLTASILKLGTVLEIK
jgi:hypothetical protein